MDTHIKELITKKNYSQALKVITNKLKKSPNDPRLSISKAEIWLASGGANLKSCRDLCTTLCARKLTDRGQVADLYDIICRLGEHDPSFENPPEALALWQEAIKNARRADDKLDLVQDWMSQSIQYEKWAMLAQGALISHRMASQNSKERKMCFFWYITARFLTSLPATTSEGNAANSSQNGNGQTNIDRMVAIGSLKKLVKDAPEQRTIEPSQSHGLWISQPPELRLLCQIYTESKEYQLLLDTFNDEKMAEVVRQDYAFVYSKDQAISHVTQQIPKWQWAKEVIQNALTRDSWFEYDNWHFWHTMLDDIARLDKDQDEGQTKAVLQSALDFIDLCKNKSPSSRCPQLAELKLRWQILHDYTQFYSNDDRQKFNKHDLILGYFQRNASQAFLVEDLTPFLAAFNDEEFVKLRADIGELVEKDSRDLTEGKQLLWLEAEINALSLDFARLEMRFSTMPATELIPKYEKLITNSLRLYQVSRSHTKVLPEKAMEPGDLACQLACSALRNCMSKTADLTFGMRALCLLNFLTEQSRYNFRARQDYVVLAINLGLPATAWESYKLLDVKKVLHESLAPQMFDRISLLYPSASKQFDAHAAMEKPLRWYEDSLAEIPDFQELALKHENYASAVDMKAFADQLRRSPTRIMMVYERRRIARLTGKRYEAIDRVFNEKSFPQPKPVWTKDETRSAAGEKNARQAGLQTDDHIKWLIYVDAAFEYATSQDFAPTPAPDPGLQEYTHKCQNLINPTQPQTLEITPFESVVLGAAGILIKIVDTLTSHPTNLENLHNLLSTLRATIVEQKPHSFDMINSRHETPFIPPASWICNAVLTLDLCRVVHKLATRISVYAKRKSPPLVLAKETLKMAESTQADMEARVKYVHAETAKWKGKIGIALKEGTCVGLAFGMVQRGEKEGTSGLDDEILKIMGSKNLEAMMNAFANSAIVGLDGILKIKVG